MEIKLYKCADDKRVLSKTLSGAVSKTCVVKDDNNSILNPRVQIAQFSAFKDYNYAYIPDYGRYYYIDDMAVDLGGLISLALSVDVLQTYSAQIRATKALIYRQSQNFNPLIADSLLQSQVNEVTITRPLEGGELTNNLGRGGYNFVLTTYKGGLINGV